MASHFRHFTNRSRHHFSSHVPIFTNPIRELSMERAHTTENLLSIGKNTKQQQKSFLNHERKVCCFRVVRGGSEGGRCEKIERETARATCWIPSRYVRGSTAWSMSQGASRSWANEREKRFIGKTFCLMPLFVFASLSHQHKRRSWNEVRGGSTDLMVK